MSIKTEYYSPFKPYFSVLKSRHRNNTIYHVVLYSGPGGWRSVQSPSCGLLGKARPVLAAREVLRGDVDQSQVWHHLYYVSK